MKAFVVILLALAFGLTGCKKPDDPANTGNDNNQNDSIIGADSLVSHGFVDLGLPSGTLWAVCNVGAATPEDFGDYFSWGETSTKEIYSWNTYQYGDFVDEHFELTKYCSDPSFGLHGFVDTLTVLEPVDDAARANWGSDWRMPTKEEWNELYRKTTCAGTTQHGVYGWLFTGRNGNSIFLPAAGFRLNGELICTGLGVYWSSSLHTEFLDRGWSLHFDADNCHVCGTYERSRGQVIRAVIAK